MIGLFIKCSIVSNEKSDSSISSTSAEEEGLWNNAYESRASNNLHGTSGASDSSSEKVFWCHISSLETSNEKQGNNLEILPNSDPEFYLGTYGPISVVSDHLTIF